MPFLRHASAEHGIRFFPIDKDVVTIGRSKGCDIAIEDESISRRHCQVRRDGDKFVLEDLQSKNGTCVNGAPIQHWSLSDGDLISMGDEKLIFKLQK